MSTVTSEPGARLSTVGARWVWAPVLLIGLALFEGVRQIFLTTNNNNLLPTVVLLGALVVPVTFVVFVTGRRFETAVPAAWLAATALCGGAVGVAVAGLLEFDTVHRVGPGAMLGIAAIEEAAKLLIPILLLVCGPWRRVGDGLAIGVACGAGFAVLETLGYVFVSAANSHGSVRVIDDLLAVRGVLSPAAHMAWTGIAAAALWAAAGAGFRRRDCVRLSGALVLVIGLHALWDGLGTPVAYAVLATISLTTMAAVAVRIRTASSAVATTERPSSAANRDGAAS